MADAIIEKQNETIATEEERHSAEWNAQREVHQRSIHENYRSLFESAYTAGEQKAAPSAPVYPAQAPERSAASTSPALTADPAARIADWNAHHVTMGQRPLGEGIMAAAGELVRSVPAVDTAAMPQVAPAAMPQAAPAPSEESEDARPTARTMALLNREEEAAIEAGETGFFAALPTKLKVALLVVMSAVLAAIAVIFINTSVLRSMDARIETERASIKLLEERASEVHERFLEVSDPDNIAEWAESNGMVKTGEGAED